MEIKGYLVVRSDRPLIGTLSLVPCPIWKSNWSQFTVRSRFNVQWVQQTPMMAIKTRETASQVPGQKQMTLPHSDKQSLSLGSF